MGNSSSSGGGQAEAEAVNSAPAQGPKMARKFYTGLSTCDVDTEAMVGIQFAPYNASDVGGKWGFGMSAVCAKSDGTTRVAKFAATGDGTYADSNRTINTGIQGCPSDSYAVGVGLANHLANGDGLSVRLKCATMPALSSNFEYLALRANATPRDPVTSATADQVQSNYDAKWAELMKSAPASTR